MHTYVGLASRPSCSSSSSVSFLSISSLTLPSRDLYGTHAITEAPTKFADAKSSSGYRKELPWASYKSDNATGPIAIPTAQSRNTRRDVSCNNYASGTLYRC